MPSKRSAKSACGPSLCLKHHHFFCIKCTDILSDTSTDWQLLTIQSLTAKDLVQLIITYVKRCLNEDKPIASADIKNFLSVVSQKGKIISDIHKVLVDGVSYNDALVSLLSFLIDKELEEVREKYSSASTSRLKRLCTSIFYLLTPFMDVIPEVLLGNVEDINADHVKLSLMIVNKLASSNHTWSHLGFTKYMALCVHTTQHLDEIDVKPSVVKKLVLKTKVPKGYLKFVKQWSEDFYDLLSVNRGTIAHTLYAECSLDQLLHLITQASEKPKEEMNEEVRDVDVKEKPTAGASTQSTPALSDVFFTIDRKADEIANGGESDAEQSEDGEQGDEEIIAGESDEEEDVDEESDEVESDEEQQDVRQSLKYHGRKPPKKKVRLSSPPDSDEDDEYNPVASVDEQLIDAREQMEELNSREEDSECEQDGKEAVSGSGDDSGADEDGEDGIESGEEIGNEENIQVDDDDRAISGEDEAVSGEDGAVSEEDGAVSEEDGAVSGEDWVASGEDGAVSGEDGAVSGEDGAVSGEDGAVSEEDGAVSEEDGVASGEDGAVSGEESTTSEEESTTSEEESTTSEEESTTSEEEGTASTAYSTTSHYDLVFSEKDMTASRENAAAGEEDGAVSEEDGAVSEEDNEADNEAEGMDKGRDVAVGGEGGGKDDIEEKYVNDKHARESDDGEAREGEARESDEEAGVSDEESGVSDEEAGLSDEKAGLSDEKAGVSSEETGVTSEEAGVGNENAGLSDKEVGINDEEAGVSNEKAGVSDEEAGLSDEEAGVSNKEAGVSNEEAGVSNEKAGVSDEEAELSDEEGGVSNAKAGVSDEEAGLSDEEAGLSNAKSLVDLSSDSNGEMEVSGREEISEAPEDDGITSPLWGPGSGDEDTPADAEDGDLSNSMVKAEPLSPEYVEKRARLRLSTSGTVYEVIDVGSEDSVESSLGRPFTVPSPLTLEAHEKSEDSCLLVNTASWSKASTDKESHDKEVTFSSPKPASSSPRSRPSAVKKRQKKLVTQTHSDDEQPLGPVTSTAEISPKEKVATGSASPEIVKMKFNRCPDNETQELADTNKTHTKRACSSNSEPTEVAVKVSRSADAGGTSAELSSSRSRRQRSIKKGSPKPAVVHIDISQSVNDSTSLSFLSLDAASADCLSASSAEGGGDKSPSPEVDLDPNQVDNVTSSPFPPVCSVVSSELVVRSPSPAFSPSLPATPDVPGEDSGVTDTSSSRDDNRSSPVLVIDQSPPATAHVPDSTAKSPSVSSTHSPSKGLAPSNQQSPTTPKATSVTQITSPRSRTSTPGSRTPSSRRSRITKETIYDKGQEKALEKVASEFISKSSLSSTDRTTPILSSQQDTSVELASGEQADDQLASSTPAGRRSSRRKSTKSSKLRETRSSRRSTPGRPGGTPMVVIDESPLGGEESLTGLKELNSSAVDSSSVKDSAISAATEENMEGPGPDFNVPAKSYDGDSDSSMISEPSRNTRSRKGRRMSLTDASSDESPKATRRSTRLKRPVATKFLPLISEQEKSDDESGDGDETLLAPTPALPSLSADKRRVRHGSSESNNSTTYSLRKRRCVLAESSDTPAVASNAEAKAGTTKTLRSTRKRKR